MLYNMKRIDCINVMASKQRTTKPKEIHERLTAHKGGLPSDQNGKEEDQAFLYRNGNCAVAQRRIICCCRICFRAARCCDDGAGDNKAK